MKHIFQKTTNKIVTIVAIFDAGARAEYPKYSLGLAHMMEHMIFKGTYKRNYLDISKEIAFLGGTSNAVTSHEMVYFYIRLPFENFENGMEILSDLVFNASLPEIEFHKEKQVVLEEALEYKDDTTFELQEMFDKNFFTGRLSYELIGTEDSIMNFSYDELKRFYQEFYTPENGILAISGDLDADLVSHTSEKYFKSPTEFKKSAPQKQSEIAISQQEVFQIKNDDIEQTYLTIAYPGLTIHKEDSAAAIGLSRILSDGPDSRLWTELRDKNNLCYHIDLSTISYLECGAWVISSSLSHKKLEKMIAILDREINKIKKKPISDEEMIRMKNKFKADIYALYDSGYSLLMDLANREFFGLLSLEDLTKKVDNLEKKDIQNLAKKIFDPSRRKIFIMGPEKEKEKEG